MKILRLSLNANNKHLLKPSVVTIGKFDGLHVGHKKLITNLVYIAKKKNLLSNIIIFEPYPDELIKQDIQYTRINTLRNKIEILKQYNIDQVIILLFNQKLMTLSPTDFIFKILIKILNMKHIVIGNDFKFGYNKEGNELLIKKLSNNYNFQITKIYPVVMFGERISSSRIKKLLLKQKLNKVSSLLGRAYSIYGRIYYGKKIGTKIGFPTINIPLKKTLVVSGVYIVKIYTNNKIYFGISNIGNKPTVSDNTYSLETHIFNLNCNLYGHKVNIEFLSFIRKEIKFSSINELKNQIAKDKIFALNWLQYLNN